MAAPAPKIDPKRLRPSRLWYWVAGAIAVAGVVLAGFLFFSILRPLFDDVDKFGTGQPVTVNLDKGEERTIYAQTAGSPASPGLQTTDVPADDLECKVDGPGESPVEVSRADSFTLTKNADKYQAKFEFKARASGKHVVQCTYLPDTGASPALAVGPHFGTVGFVARLLGFFAALFGGPLVGGLLAGGVALLRHRSKKRLQEEERASWPPPGAGPPADFMDAGR
jgi:hypothetical protein